ncbi:DNA/RNA non-specific endonuclease [Chitinophaga sp. MM2321]|uniref:DNA/RNA non-specific endonuclease n=1 Tax=Chitinophaga sp. MM2321 TaxID=3137178 RepID=UPI0032D584E1
MPKKRKKKKNNKKNQQKSQQNNSLAIVVILILVAFVVTTCSRKITGSREKDPVEESSPQKNNKKPVASPLLQEDFGKGNKTSYNTGNVILSSGSWELKDAMTGGLQQDRKTGNQALRIRGNGMAGMNFDIAVKGTVTVTLKHAMFGADKKGTWELWASVNKGQRYTRVGHAVTTTGTVLQHVSFTASTTAHIRFSIRKTDKSRSRINFDAFTVTAGGKVLPVVPDKPVEDKVAAGDNDNLLLGNPSNATASVLMVNNYLMDKGYYKLSYSRDKGGPNWVSWHVSRSDLGSMSRGRNFRPDEDLPGDWYQVLQTGYLGSGFDRGHNCPSGDRTASRAANAATFLMTNMIPQAPNHNQHLWSNLENYTRSLVRAGNEVYVIMGSYGSGGVGSNGPAKRIADKQVNVPDRIWKVIVVLREGNNDLQRISKNTRIIAVNTPNKNDVNTNWTAYLTSIEEIEKATSYRLLSNVPEQVRQELVKKVDVGE